MACREQVNAVARGAEEFVTADVSPPGGVAGAKAAYVRSQQRGEAQLPAQRFIEHFNLGMHEQDREMRIGEYVFYEPVATLGFRIREAVKDAIPLRVFDQMIQVTLFLVAKRFSVADEKLKVACVRLIDIWIVNLLDVSLPEGEPEPRTSC